MGLTVNSVGARAAAADIHIKSGEKPKIFALAGNPNVGKSTLFNALTGMNQHTGNWAGKTVSAAVGGYFYNGAEYILADLPGAYSLSAHSREEEAARDFLCFEKPCGAVVVCDASCLERNLNLVIQTMEITPRVLVCVNLLDEAERKNISVDLKKLEELLGVPVVGVTAREGKGLEEFRKRLEELSESEPKLLDFIYGGGISSSAEAILPIIPTDCFLPRKWVALKLLEEDEGFHKKLETALGADFSAENNSGYFSEALRLSEESGISKGRLSDGVVTCIYKKAEEIAAAVVTHKDEKFIERDRRLDKILTHRIWGTPLMVALLGAVLWLTIWGANYPSELLFKGLFFLGGMMERGLRFLSAPDWLTGLLIDGVYRVLAWVTSVMLPPMAIFFPLFTLLEDSGYLPRVAFNLDRHFQRACACGKQALSMCMGLGCNAAGVVGCRIIDSPRERLIAILTNSFVPCNGRFPAMIAIITMFFLGGAAGFPGSALSALMLTAVILLGVVMTFLTSRLLSKTILKGIPSSFTLELPPYRKPQIGRVVIRSVMDRTLFVLGRAAAVAAPAGLVLWLFANISAGEASLLSVCTDFIDPFAKLLGLDGVILFAFILGFPANEIVVPIIIMSYLSEGKILEMGSLIELRELLVSNGWTWTTALCTIVFSLFHWPCSTTCITIYKETKSLKWTLASILLPALTGMTLCAMIYAISRILV